MYKELPEYRRRHVRKEKKINGLLQKTPKMLSTSHAVLLWR